MRLPLSYALDRPSRSAWIITDNAGGQVGNVFTKDEASEIVRACNAIPDCIAALSDVCDYLEAIENIANQIGERKAIQSKIATVKAALTKAK